jgi:hypothetical protein
MLIWFSHLPVKNIIDRKKGRFPAKIPNSGDCGPFMPHDNFLLPVLKKWKARTEHALKGCLASSACHLAYGGNN